MFTKRILCVGLCNLDIIQLCESYPKEDSDQRSSRSIWQRGGNASNNCTVLALLGAPCELLATFADGEHFRYALDDLRTRNIGIEHCVRHPGCEVPLSTVWLSLETGSRTIVHSNPNLPELTLGDFQRCDLTNYSWIHFEGRRSASVIAEMIKHVKHFNETNDSTIIVSVDLEKPRDSNLLLIPNADYVFLGKDFAQHLGYTSSKDAVYGIKQSNPGRYTVICLWGGSDINALDVDGTSYTCGVFPPEKIKDSLGAGDTFCAGCIFKLNQGSAIPEAIQFGSRLAGSKLAELGFDHLKVNIG
ncbi:ketohexokinase-like isoform X1 [Uranotaenia lowii]|uniref:ketohexokinase-like isoform X1 n=1 Tax=Uranotaenia lowii TaxID=190385 RepID=UPI00247B027B|nr:ketohexokinase-like isoform X1 [Uranotaenia lowii]